jgi:urease accessory protein
VDFRLWQWVDSGFPAGSFAHSQGLEALWQVGALKAEGDVALRLSELAWHVGFSALPFVMAAARGDAAQVDERNEVFLSNHVANRASRAQGRAFAMAADATLGTAGPARSLPRQHLAVVFGVTLGGAGFPVAEIQSAFLFTSVRSALSAVVRLGLSGPLEGQRVLNQLHPVLAQVLDQTAGLGVDDATSVAWLTETAQAGQDRLYSRLFQS